MIEFEAPYFEAKQILDDYDQKAHTFGVESEFKELKYLVKKYYQRQKDAKKARDEVDEILKRGQAPVLETFLQGKECISALMKDLNQFEQLKSKYGREIAKFTRSLIKQEYAKQTESKISDALLRLQIALLKQAS